MFGLVITLHFKFLFQRWLALIFLNYDLISPFYLFSLFFLALTLYLIGNRDDARVFSVTPVTFIEHSLYFGKISLL